MSSSSDSVIRAGRPGSFRGRIDRSITYGVLAANRRVVVLWAWAEFVRGMTELAAAGGQTDFVMRLDDYVILELPGHAPGGGANDSGSRGRKGRVAISRSPKAVGPQPTGGPRRTRPRSLRFGCNGHPVFSLRTQTAWGARRSHLPRRIRMKDRAMPGSLMTARRAIDRSAQSRFERLDNPPAAFSVVQRCDATSQCQAVATRGVSGAALAQGLAHAEPSIRTEQPHQLHITLW